MAQENPPPFLRMNDYIDSLVSSEAPAEKFTQEAQDDQDGGRAALRGLYFALKKENEGFVARYWGSARPLSEWEGVEVAKGDGKERGFEGEGCDTANKEEVARALQWWHKDINGGLPEEVISEICVLNLLFTPHLPGRWYCRSDRAVTSRLQAAITPPCYRLASA